MSDPPVMPAPMARILMASVVEYGGRGTYSTIESGEPSFDVEFPYNGDLSRWLMNTGADVFQHQRSDRKPAARWLLTEVDR